MLKIRNVGQQRSAMVSARTSHQRHNPRHASKQHDSDAEDHQSPRLNAIETPAKLVPGQDTSDVEENRAVEQGVDDILERVVLRLDSEPVIPRECVSCEKEDD